LRNAGDRPVEAHLLGRTPAFDIVVEDARGNVVWQRLGGAMISAILQLRTLAPDETLEWRAAWRPQEPGTYSLRGIVPTDEREPIRTKPVHLHVV
jgi:hypothetical protein